MCDKIKCSNCYCEFNI